MKKKLLLTMIAMLSSIAMFTGCSSTSTPTETTTDSTTNTTTDETTTDEIPLDEGFIVDEDFFMDMENLEISDEEMAQLLGFSGDAESFKDGDMLFDVGSANVDDFDILYEGETINFMYDSSIWIESGFPIDGVEVILIDNNPVDFDAPANIYYTPINEMPTYISMNEYMEMIVESSVGTIGVEVLSCGVDFYEDYEVGMIETVESYSDELIDELIEYGYFTETDLEEIGGRDTLLSLPDMHQVFMIARKGSDAYTFSGAYYSNDIKRDEVIAAADGYLQTVTKN